MIWFTISSEHSVKEDIQEHNLQNNIQKIENFTDCELGQ